MGLVDGIVEEANDTAGKVDDNAVLDAALINAAPARRAFCCAAQRREPRSWPGRGRGA